MVALVLFFSCLDAFCKSGHEWNDVKRYGVSGRILTNQGSQAAYLAWTADIERDVSLSGSSQRTDN